MAILLVIRMSLKLAIWCQLESVVAAATAVDMCKKDSIEICSKSTKQLLKQLLGLGLVQKL